MIYLAHPFPLRHELRVWELHLEVSLGITILNPFYDLSREDVIAIDQGSMARYAPDAQELVERDLAAIKGCSAVLAYVNGAFSIGTPQEIVYAYLWGIPVYCLVSNGHEDHPWLVYHCEKIVTSKEDMEEFLRIELD